MELIILFRLRLLALISIILVAIFSSSDCYNLDPRGNITVTFDIHELTKDGYVSRVTIQNNYKYKEVEKPGWALGWVWANNEVIWSMSGALVTHQGDCSSYKYQTPYSCKKDPLILDLNPAALPENRTQNCCHGGILAARAIDRSKSFSCFEMTVGNLGGNVALQMPLNLSLRVPGPGCTCSTLLDTHPILIGHSSNVQLFKTWKAGCTCFH